jgi:hypothetical protein
MVQNKFSAMAAVLVGLILQGGGTVPVPIAIENPSFEEFSVPASSDQCGTHEWFAAGWQASSGALAFQPANPNPCGIATPPNGPSVAVVGYGSSFSQVLAVTPLQIERLFNPPTDGTYVFRFLIANYFPKYPGYYEAKIYVGPHELCSTDGWGPQRFTKITLVCPAPGYLTNTWPNAASPSDGQPSQPANPEDHLIISFTGNVWPVMIAGPVSLNFSPE